MRFVRRESAGGPDGGTPAPRHPAGGAGRAVALAGLALAVLGLNGCASDPCGGGGCGGCGGGHLAAIGNGFRSASASAKNAMAKVFRCHKCKGYAPAGCDSCGGAGVVEGMPVEGGNVLPGPIITVPGGSPAGAPMKENPPTILEPAAPGAAGGRSSSSVNPAGARAGGPAVSRSDRPRPIESGVAGRGTNLARAVDLSPPSRPASASSASPLDDLPPVDLSGDIARRGSMSPVPTEAGQVRPASATATTPSATATPSNRSASTPAPASTQEAEAPVLKVGLDAPLAPGVRHFASVRPNISGGSAPGRAGLDWLRDKGIKTLVDLRPAAEVEPGFVDDVKARGFRHVGLPVDISKPDVAALSAFRDEVTKAENQPVYFFDADGIRAGMLWYVHRLTADADKVDAQTATREAEELGLAGSDRASWVAATRLLDAARTPPNASGPSAAPSARVDGDGRVSTLLTPLLRADPAALSAANPPRASLEGSAQ